ncbi:MAG: prolipoprotein diacylglyceryl transferase [Kineosporiaceae bacterium]
MPAGIPYTSFPEIPLGPITLQTFGLCVAVGVILGAWLTVRRNRRLGISVDQSERIIMLLVVAGLVGARLLWVITAWDQIESPIDVIAVWNGGLQFSGGFIAALLLAPVLTRRLSSEQRWHLLDGAAMGLALGLAIGRIGCYAVGEHLGGPTSFPLGITYQGGPTVEGPLAVGETYWSTPVLEFLYVLVILGIMLWVDRRGTAGAGTIAGIFCALYAVARFGSDFLREFDQQLFGLTGAQYMTFALVVLGAWFLWTARRRESPASYRARLSEAAARRAVGAAATTDGDASAPSSAALDGAASDGAASDADTPDADTPDSDTATGPVADRPATAAGSGPPEPVAGQRRAE